MPECGWCGKELPEYVWGDRGHNARLYCCLSHKQLAYIARLTPAALTALLARKAAARKKRGTR